MLCGRLLAGKSVEVPHTQRGQVGAINDRFQQVHPGAVADAYCILAQVSRNDWHDACNLAVAKTVKAR
jgi:hypothetical protein